MSKKKTEAPETQSVTVPRGEIVKAMVVDLDEAQQTVELVKSIEIRTNDQYIFAGNALKEIAQRHDAIKAKRDKWTLPLMEVVKDIKSTVDPVIKCFAQVEEILKAKIGAYVVQVASEKAQFVSAASVAYSAGEAGKGAALVTQAALQDTPEVEGIGVKTVWTGEMIDGNALIDAVLTGKLGKEYLLPNSAMCLAATEIKQGDPQIPGWRAFVTANVRTSRRG